jgi:hypothetical protein
MKDVRVTRRIRATAWTGAISSPARENSFAAWIVSRWAPPDRVRRMSPQRDFRASGRHGTWFALSAHVLQSSWHMALAFGSRTWTDVTQNFDLRRTFSRLISVAYGAAEFFQRTALSQITPMAWSFFPTSFQWNRVRATQQRSFSFHVHLPSQVSVPNPLRETRVRGARPPLSATMLSRTSFRHFVPARMKIDHIWQGNNWQIRRGLRILRSRTVLQTAATKTVTTHKPTAGPIRALALHAELLHFTLRKTSHELLTRSSMPVLPGAKPATKDEIRHPHLILHLREAVDRAHSRPSMQFAQAATPNQPEVLSAIRNVEKTLSKVQPVFAPTPHALPDMQLLTSQVYDQLERQLRIERERRGR